MNEKYNRIRYNVTIGFIFLKKVKVHIFYETVICEFKQFHHLIVVYSLKQTKILRVLIIYRVLCYYFIGLTHLRSYLSVCGPWTKMNLIPLLGSVKNLNTKDKFSQNFKYWFE